MLSAIMLSVIMLNVIYAECHLCCVPNRTVMLSVFMMRVVMVSVNMLNVMAPSDQRYGGILAEGDEV